MSSSFIDRLNALSDSWAAWMGAALIETAVVAAVIGLIWLAVRKRTSPQLGYLLFLLIPLRLLIPLEIHVPGIPAVWSSPQTKPDETNSVIASPAAYYSEEPARHRVHQASASSTITSVSTIGKSDSVARSSLSSSSWLMVAWGAGVLFLFARLIVAQIRFARLVRRARELDLSNDSIAFQTLCERIGVGLVTVLESDEIDSPAVCGLFRPKIVLPTGILKSLSVKQREWILFHELAHIRRRDLLVNCVQRLVAILHFPNPAMWLANSQINQWREYVCDDVASSLSDASEVESSEAFLFIVRHASSKQRQPLLSCASALGMSRSRSQRACYHRMTRLLETGLAQSAKLGWRSLMLLTVSAVVVLPRLRAAEQSPGQDPVSPVSVAATNQGTATVQDPKTSDSAEPTKPAIPAQVDLNIIVAKHVLLLEGKEIITWEWLRNKFATSADPSQFYPHFYITRGAMEAGLYQPSKDRIWNLHKDFKFNGHSEGSLWPRTDFRYDKIETADDLKPDPALLKTGTVTVEGKPVAGAEVVLITPVDESIGYKTYHFAFVEGRIRNRLEHVMTVSDEQGNYSLYPPQDTPYYVLAVHPEGGFSLVSSDSFLSDATLRLMAWSGLVSKLKDEKGEQQVDLTTSIRASGGKPEISINQYWSDRRIEQKDRTFVYHRIPPIFDTTVSRSFPSPDGGATSLPAATVSLLPGETRTIEFGEITPQQREWLDGIRTRFRSTPAPAKPE